MGRFDEPGDVHRCWRSWNIGHRC